MCACCVTAAHSSSVAMWAMKLNKAEWLHMVVGSVSAIATGLRFQPFTVL